MKRLKTVSSLMLLAFWGLSVRNTSAAILYVNVNGTNPIAPYSNWSTAAKTIQTAIDAANAGDQILVTNGFYQTGGRIVYGALSNRVAVTKAVTVQSVNGAGVTVIRGYQLPGTTNGDGAIRCVYLTNGASLIGFTLTNGATRVSGNGDNEQGGGGIFCPSANAFISNCILVGNAAGWEGGGAVWGTFRSCSFVANSAPNGGAAISSVLNNCTVFGNSASTGGGVFGGAANNSIVYYNSASSAANYTGSLVNYCCTVPSPGGVGNIAAEPQLTDNAHIGSTSPCRGAGNTGYATGTDIDGESWLNPPSIGCDEYHAGVVAGPLTVAVQANYTNVGPAFGVTFTGQITGRASVNVWDFGDGTRVTNQFYSSSHSWAAAGDYPVVLTAYNDDNPAGVSATVTMHVIEGIYYVALNSANPVPPFTSWATAATNIQDALDAVLPGNGLVLVSNGIYATGGRVVNGAMSNRVAVTKAVTVESINGPAVTVIRGYQVPGTTNGDGAIRCVYLANGASLIGFTLTNGATRVTGNGDSEQGGGGIFCPSVNAFITNCILVGNAAGWEGGGAVWGTFRNCSFVANSARSGGGAISSVLNNCTLVNNSATFGGGASAGVLNNCVVAGNLAADSGGGVFNNTVNGCTVTGNFSVSGGGAYGSALNNCVVYYNSALNGSNYFGGTLKYCCTLPLPAGTGNITTEPQLTDFAHISSTSPCRGAGNAVYTTGTDIDGEPWLNPPSIGCDEYHAGAVTGPLSVAVQASYTNVSPGFSFLRGS